VGRSGRSGGRRRSGRCAGTGRRRVHDDDHHQAALHDDDRGYDGAIDHYPSVQHHYDAAYQLDDFDHHHVYASAMPTGAVHAGNAGRDDHHHDGRHYDYPAPIDHDPDLDDNIDPQYVDFNNYVTLNLDADDIDHDDDDASDPPGYWSRIG
jgi:hypothetical protein